MSHEWIIKKSCKIYIKNLNLFKIHLHYCKLDHTVKTVGILLQGQNKQRLPEQRLHYGFIAHQFDVGGLLCKQTSHQFNCTKTCLKKTYSEYNKNCPRLGYFCPATIKAWITSSNQMGRKQSSTQTSSPVNKIVWRTEWAALGWWKSIKSGVRWLFGGDVCCSFLIRTFLCLIWLCQEKIIAWQEQQ